MDVGDGDEESMIGTVLVLTVVEFPTWVDVVGPADEELVLVERSLEAEPVVPLLVMAVEDVRTPTITAAVVVVFLVVVFSV